MSYRCRHRRGGCRVYASHDFRTVYTQLKTIRRARNADCRRRPGGKDGDRALGLIASAGGRHMDRPRPWGGRHITPDHDGPASHRSDMLVQNNPAIAREHNGSSGLASNKPYADRDLPLLVGSDGSVILSIEFGRRSPAQRRARILSGAYHAKRRRGRQIGGRARRHVVVPGHPQQYRQVCVGRPARP